MKYIVDRIEDGIFVLEDENGNFINKKDLGIKAVEGDCLKQKENGDFELDIIEKENREKVIKQLMDDLFI